MPPTPPHPPQAPRTRQSAIFDRPADFVAEKNIVVSEIKDCDIMSRSAGGTDQVRLIAIGERRGEVGGGYGFSDGCGDCWGV